MIEKITNIYLKIIRMLELLFMPILILVIRFWMAKIFWYSGLTKISDWQSTIFLFKYEYKVPVIPPEIAALLSTSVELVAPVLLLIGLATRLTVIPMLAMTAVIQFTYEYSNEHYYWTILLATILCYGPGRLSVDSLITKRFIKNASVS